MKLLTHKANKKVLNNSVHRIFIYSLVIQGWREATGLDTFFSDWLHFLWSDG